MSTFSEYLQGAELPPITTALCETWNPNQQAVQMYGPTGPPQVSTAALIDAIHALETAVIALQGG